MSRGVVNGHDIVVIGASTGGIEALPTLVSALPKEFPASIFVVQHVSAQGESYLPKILERSSELRALHPRDKQKIERGVVYVAPPDHHLWLEDSQVRVTQGPRVNRHRPAVDVLFESAAHVYRQRVVGVILTGALGDGAAGLYAVKRCGGIAIVQDPVDAIVASMPTAALRYVQPDHVLPLRGIPAVLEQLATIRPKKKRISCPPVRFAVNAPSQRPDEMEKQYGPASGLICPECGGPLWELRDGKMVKYRCLTGHSYSTESLIQGEKVELERALWTAAKILEERAGLLRKLGKDSAENKRLQAAKVLNRRAEALEAQGKTVRKIACNLESVPTEEDS